MQQKLPISIVLIVRNEERNLAECLESCSFASEVILVDDNSSDKTRDIGSQFGCKIFVRSLDGDWGAQQTFAMEQATQPWLLLIDADERVTPKLYDSLKSAVEKNERFCYQIQRENHFTNGKATHGVLRPDWVDRFLPREGARVEGKVHPKIISPFSHKKLTGRLIHFPYRSWGSYWKKFDKYTQLSAEKYLLAGKRCHFFRDIILRPFWAFFKIYFLQGGFLDGKLGWIFSVNHYLYTMTKYVRLYTLQKYNGEI